MKSNILGAQLAQVRKSKKITQQQLGKRVGLPKTSISKIENGHTRITWEDAAILMEAMGEKMPNLTLDYAESEINLTQKEQLIISSLEWFSRHKKIPLYESYQYLSAYQGIDFLINNYRIEQTLPKVEILKDIQIVCNKNGGRL